MGFHRVVLPKASADRLTDAERAGLTLVPVRSLRDALADLLGSAVLP